MAYRPITDIWIMARPKVAYYGAFPAGFVERARALLGVTINDPVLHVCGGKVRDYPYLARAVGPNDATVDLDPDLKPDYLMDVRKLGAEKGDLFPYPGGRDLDGGVIEVGREGANFDFVPPHAHWSAALVDRPYTEADAENYAPGADALPDPNDLLKRSLSVVRPGGRVGFLDYYIPRPPKKVGDHEVKFVACIGVMVGFGNRIRAFTVFERVAPNPLLNGGGTDRADEPATVPEETETPLVEPTPAEVEALQRIMDEAEARKRLCRMCWGERQYPLPGPEHQPTPEAKCDDCGHKATLMPVSILLSADDGASLTVPSTGDPALDGF